MELGWPQERIKIIDEDLAHSGLGLVLRQGFTHLISVVALGHAGLILSLEVSRVARNNADWYRLLDLCGVTDTLIGDADGLYHPGLFNDRLLLGLKGTMAEAELHVLRARLDGGIRNKAARGELRRANLAPPRPAQDFRAGTEVSQQLSNYVADRYARSARWPRAAGGCWGMGWLKRQAGENQFDRSLDNPRALTPVAHHSTPVRRREPRFSKIGPRPGGNQNQAGLRRGAGPARRFRPVRARGLRAPRQRPPGPKRHASFSDFNDSPHCKYCGMQLAGIISPARTQWTSAGTCLGKLQG